MDGDAEGLAHPFFRKGRQRQNSLTKHSFVATNQSVTMGLPFMDYNSPNLIQDFFDFLRNLPLFSEHYDKLFVVLGVLAALYFVGAMVRNVLIGATVIFLLWGFRYQETGYSHHVNRYTGAVCESGRECWMPARSPEFDNRPRDFDDRPRYR